MIRRAAAWALEVVVVLGVGMAVAPAARAVADPHINPSTASAAPGATILVTLAGFTSTTTVTVCGNNALRGDVDCDLLGGVAVGSSDVKPQEREMILTVPPTLCPCVLRAATTADGVVRTIPFDLTGVGVGPLTGDSTVTGSTLAVTAVIKGGSTSLLDGLRSSLGGQTKRTLVLTLANAGVNVIDGITVTAAVGRDAQSGEPVQAPVLEAIGPGETKVVEMDVTLSAPAIGDYTVFGSVYAHRVASPFKATMANTPWLLYLVLVVLVVDVLAYTYIRIRCRRLDRDRDDVDDEEWDVAEPPTLTDGGVNHG